MKKERTKITRFIAIDGEGKNNPAKNHTYIDSDGKRQHSEYQDYVLLRSNTDFPRLYNPTGLSTADCLSWLCDLALSYPDYTFIIFGSSYDVTMWLRDLTYKEWLTLWNYARTAEKYQLIGDGKKRVPKIQPLVLPLKVNGDAVAFELEYIQRKYFKVSRYECYVKSDGTWAYRRDKRGNRIRRGSITVYDVWGFFQTSFVNALQEYGLLSDEDDARFIASMKSKRDKFESMDIETIDAYCRKECEYLVRLMEKLQSYFLHPEIDVHLSRWDGAGAAAAALLEQKQIKNHIAPLPDPVQQAALHAYSGGRIELVQYGHTHSKEYTEKQARAYCKKEYGDEELFREKFIACTYLRRKKTQKLVTEKRALAVIHRKLTLDGVLPPRDAAHRERYQMMVELLLKQYYDFDHVAYLLPCIYSYDINSAYPSVIATLPSLAGGEWKLEHEIRSQFSLVHIRWKLAGQRFYPFFFRTRKYLIVYPDHGENWVWLPEYQAYLKHAGQFQGSVEILEVWNFYPATDEKPFAFVPDMAAKRLEWKKLSKQTNSRQGGQHVAVKLMLNSLYGKFAQQVGGYQREDGTWKLPPFHNIAWAGYITSATRAKLFDAAMQDPNAVIMFATDGLFTTHEFDLALSTALGDWERTRYTRFTAVMAGVYYAETQDWQALSKSRGFEKGSITEKDVLEGWRRGPQRQEDGTYTWEVSGTARHFITFGRIAVGETPATIKKNMRRLAGWERIERKLALEPNGTKRMDDPRYDRWKRFERLVPTLPVVDYENEYDHLSTPYRSPYHVDPRLATDEELRYIKEQEEKQTDENLA